MTGVLTQLVLDISGSIELSILAKATAILVLALAAVWISPRVSASVRSLVLACAFGILLMLPVAVVLMPPVALNVRATRMAPETSGPSAAIAALGDDSPVVTPIERPASSVTNRWHLSARLLLMAAWTTGTVLFLAPVIGTLGRIRRLRRSAVRWLTGETVVSDLSREAGLDRQVECLFHQDLVTPFTYGWLRPAIVMPSDAQHWTDADVRRAAAHELEHVRRGDWPLHVLARLACALYWFHPLVWIAWRRFCLESERACDDAVLRSSEGIAYADQLVALARRLSKRAPVPMLSMASRDDLRTRVAAVLDARQRRDPVGVVGRGSSVALAAALVLCLSPLKATTDADTGAPTQAPKHEASTVSFVRATVTPHAAGTPAGIAPLTNGRFTAGGMTLKDLIRIAYGSPTALLSSQVDGGPAWVDSDRFDIDAQVPGDMTFGASWHPQVSAMLQALLAERFKLDLSREPRPMPVADLVLANRDGKLGAGLRPAAGDCVDLLKSPSPPAARASQRLCGITQNAPGLLGGTQMTMALLAGLLSQRAEVDRVVRDRTRLDGAFDFRVEFTPDPAHPSNASPTSGTNPSPISPALVGALETQLGLRLEAHEGPVDVIVIRHAEKPPAK